VRVSVIAADVTPDEVVRFERDRVVLLDQRRLPDEYVQVACSSAAEVADAISRLVVRGAPAIGITAAMGYALAAQRGEDLDLAAKQLLDTRPTAVNLAWAIAEMRSIPPDPAALAARALCIRGAEIKRCHAMGGHAAKLFQRGSRPLTHCNTGALATTGHGTALGAIRTGHAAALVDHVHVDETRPVNQGSRLTAWELERANIPFTLLVDGAAGSLMARGEVTHVVVGADRIAANGDVANKIGTYALAVLAARHEIPFIVVAPSSSVDPATLDGGSIPVEERAANEVSSRFPARNPAFDVTPSELVTAIVTERGVHRGPYRFREERT